MPKRVFSFRQEGYEVVGWCVLEQLSDSCVISVYHIQFDVFDYIVND